MILPTFTFGNAKEPSLLVTTEIGVPLIVTVAPANASFVCLSIILPLIEPAVWEKTIEGIIPKSKGNISVLITGMFIWIMKRILSATKSAALQFQKIITV